MTVVVSKWLAVRDDLSWRNWDDDEFVVFNARSGDTHLLNRMVAIVLKALEEEPRTLDELVEIVRRECGDTWAQSAPDILPATHQDRHLHGGSADRLSETIAQALAWFDEVGLIEPHCG